MLNPDHISVLSLSECQDYLHSFLLVLNQIATCPNCHACKALAKMLVSQEEHTEPDKAINS